MQVVLSITATDTVMIDGENNQGSFKRCCNPAKWSPGAEGNAGGVQISTRSLSLTNGLMLYQRVPVGVGNAGSVSITATDTVSFDGESSQGFSSGAVQLSGNKGKKEHAKGVYLPYPQALFFLQNGAVISAVTFGVGNAGNL